MSACSHCKEQTHRTSHCPQLYDVLKEGFFTGGGAGGHSHSDDDDDDEKALLSVGIHYINGSHCRLPLLHSHHKNEAYKVPLTSV